MRKVLIVEDDKFLSAIFSLFIKDLGHNLVGRCQTGVQALDLCKDEKPDVVLMDIHLEGEIDGIETAERIQREFEIPVIFVTSDTSSYVVERAIISNSYGYLVKPVQKNELGITIDLAYYKHKVAIDQKRREQSYRQFLSEAPVPVIIVQKGLIQYLNINALNLFHSHYIEDLMGLPFVNFVTSEYQTRLKEFVEKPGTSNKTIERMDIMITGLHGKSLDVALYGSWVSFNGEPALQLIPVDITAEKTAVRDCQTFRDSLFKGGKGVMVVNRDLKIEGTTPGFRSFFNVDEESVLGDFGLESGVIKEMMECEDAVSRKIELKSGSEMHCCTAMVTGRKGFDDREVLIRIDE